MLNKYLEFINEHCSNINEGSSYNPTVIYWEDNLNEILNYNWSNISITYWSKNIYKINFRVENNLNNNYYIGLVEDKKNNDFYYMENSTTFIEKFKTEFNSNAMNYYDNLKYVPKALGNLDHIKNASKFNV